MECQISKKTSDEQEQAFVSGVLAACEFVEDAIEEMWEGEVAE
ncbi:hypothetical protein GTCCBUS3UF5_3310 [Geobacillus thermoleovorans CCB_US3_UF5]|uniref:Uncharacterized protein n=1 Tax=Geobacillus thermoleovorans CCB_US3_UF5 TaxID=1111068 RepID=A0ABN3ZPG0_GEOTH|nr:hypothetical protein GTCCBUS3UF5_3310 [Geobacillus thermoleovorans CCB_US3_UF5]